jgi:PAS domain S-box-containing protein
MHMPAPAPLDTHQRPDPLSGLPWLLRSRWYLFAGLATACGMLAIVFTYLVSVKTEAALLDEVSRTNARGVFLSARAIQTYFTGAVRYADSYASLETVADAVSRHDELTVRAYLRVMVEKNRDLDRVIVLDTAGEVWSDYPPVSGALGRVYSQREWFRGAAVTQQTYISEVFQRTAPPLINIISITSPIRNAGGQVIGYLSTQMSLKVLTAWLDGLQDLQAGFIHLFDHRGNLAKVTDPTRPPVASARVASVRQALVSNSGSFEADELTTGRASLTSYARVEPFGWTIVIQRALSDIRATTSGVRRSLVAYSIVYFGLIQLVGFFVLNLSRRFQLALFRSTRSLAASEASHRLVTETAFDAFIAIESDGTVVEWNHQAEVTFGWTRAEIVGLELAATIVPVSLRAQHRDGLQRFLTAGAGATAMLNRRLELPALHKDGHVLEVELTIWPVQLGEQWRFNAFAHDVSERNRHLAETAQQNAQLAASAQSIWIAGQRLYASEQFVSQVSHELRTPLAAIDWAAGNMLEGVLGETTVGQRDYLGAISANVTQLDVMIADFLEAGHVGAGTLTITPRQTALDAIVSEVLTRCAGQAAAAAVDVRTTFAPGLPSLWADPERTRQVLINLIDNAIKFTPPGGLVTVHARLTDGGDCVCISVTDSGCGIATGDHERIFDRLYQAEGASLASRKGLGLGLFISRALVTLQGGQLRVDSQLGEGAVFTFTIPVFSRRQMYAAVLSGGPSDDT